MEDLEGAEDEMNEKPRYERPDVDRRLTMTDVRVPLGLLLTVIGMAPCEREWQSDVPRMKGTDLRPYVHKADCRPCALRALAVAPREQES